MVPETPVIRLGASWDLGGGVAVRAIHMPGHTSGHCVLLVEPGGVAFIGDIDLSSFGPYYGDATSSLADFRRQRPATLAELVAHRFVYPRDREDLYYADAERRTIEQHLAELARAGRAVDEGGRWRAAC